MRRFSTLLAAALAATTLAVSGAAAALDCPEHFLRSREPRLTNPKLEPRTRRVCYTEFALLHSGLTRTPLWTAQHLTPERARAARDLKRTNSFHADPSIPAGERAELSDYTRSGFDRGHMAPAGDMTTPQAMDESFSLANMVPQDPDLNRNLWESIEHAVRDFSARRGDLYVVTGPMFIGENLQSLKGRILVPTHVFKAVYDPQTQTAGAYFAENRSGEDYEIVPLSRIEAMSGIEIFPGLAQAVKDAAADLPRPTLRRRPGAEAGAPRRRPAPAEPGPEAGAQDNDFVEGILEAIDKLGRR